MIIGLPPHIEQVIIAQVQAEHISVTDFFKQLPPNPAFENIDPVEYQREMRNEWD